MCIAKENAKEILYKKYNNPVSNRFARLTSDHFYGSLSLTRLHLGETLNAKFLKVMENYRYF